MKQLIVKANKLIEAKYKLTTNEQRIILYVLSQKVNKSDETFGVYTFNSTDLVEFFGNGMRNLNEIIITIKKLRNRTFFYREGDVWMDANWVSVAIVNENTKEITVEFPQLLKPYLLQLKENFTSYQLENVVYLKSSYSIRLYELLKQYVKIGSRKFTVNELKELLGIGKDEYSQFGHFKAKVLKISIDQINSNSDINIELFPVKKGRKVIALIFSIEPQPIKREQQIPGLEDQHFEQQDLFDSLIKYGCSPSEAEKYIKKYPVELIERNIQYSIEEDEKGKVDNKRGYIKSALDRDFAFKGDNSASKKDIKAINKKNMEKVIKEWKAGDHSDEIENKIENYYKEVGHPLYQNWRNFV